MPGNQMPSNPELLVAVSLKAYLSAAATRAWVDRLARLAGGDVGLPGPELAVLPAFPLLESTADRLAHTSVRWGAQDVAPSDAGNQTGEVTAALLAELGCRYVEVGHAERRRLFGEGTRLIQGKLRQAAAAGLVPIHCLGESEPGDADRASADCCAELEEVLDVLADQTDHPEIVVAYEPVWAIGKQRPAAAEHVHTVCTQLRRTLRRRGIHGRVIYGGSAGPGTFTALRCCTDGLFLGRFAHRPQALREVVREVSAWSSRTPAAPTAVP